MTKARVVAFDIDGTLLQGQSGTLILKYLMTRRLVRIRTIALCSWWGIRYKLHLPYRQNEPRERIFTDLSQYTPEGIHRMMEMFHDDIMVPRYRADGIAKVKEHVAAGAVAGETPAGEEKVRRIRTWADATFGKDGWELVHAYGDHHTDAPMLQMAQTAHAVNPDVMLRCHAKRLGWEILEWK